MSYRLIQCFELYNKYIYKINTKVETDKDISKKGQRYRENNPHIEVARPCKQVQRARSRDLRSIRPENLKRAKFSLTLRDPRLIPSHNLF